MKDETEDCIFNNIEMMKQNLSQKTISELFHNVYNNIIFSTFPYVLYKERNSESCIHKYNSGNCIAFSQFIKHYLQVNYNITSHIIVASVPSSCKVAGTPHLSHCAVLIPLSNHEFCVIDASLYFLEPMFCNLQENIQRTVKKSNVYTHTIENVNYMISRCGDCRLDAKYNQTLKDKSLCVSCHVENNQSEHWNYYLNEIMNPDNNIGHSFLTHKKNPFLMYTKVNNHIPVLKYKVNVQDDGSIMINQYPENKVVFHGNSTQFDDTRIRQELHKYLSNEYSV